MANQPLARRNVIKAAGLGLGASLAVGLGAVHAQQPAFQPPGPGPLGPQTRELPEGGVTAGIWSGDYWAQKGDVNLAMYRRRLGRPAAGAESLPVLFLVHGSSLSALSSYDISVSGKGEYSLMNVFARAGFDVWTMDHEGYGLSSRTKGNADIASGVEDLKAAVAVVQRETGRSKYHFFGESSGSIRAAAFAQSAPERVDRIVLAAFTYKGTGAAEIARRQKNIDELRSNPQRRRDAAMIRSIFSRDAHAELYDPSVTEAIVDKEMKFGDAVPSGTYFDMAANLPLVDPAKVLSPVLMTRGEWDGNSTNEDLLDFFRQLPNGDRQFSILPNTAHDEVYGKNRQLLWYAMKSFLAAPAPAS